MKFIISAFIATLSYITVSAKYTREELLLRIQHVLLDEEFNESNFEVEPDPEGQKWDLNLPDKFRIKYDLFMPVTEHEELGKRLLYDTVEWIDGPK